MLRTFFLQLLLIVGVLSQNSCDSEQSSVIVMIEKLIGLGFNLSEASKIAIEERERMERRQVREFELQKKGSGKSHINYWY